MDQRVALSTAQGGLEAPGLVRRLETAYTHTKRASFRTSCRA
jgi:hypothetical protein